MFRTVFFCIGLICALCLSCPAQHKAPSNDWYLRDPETDQVQGISVEKTYSTLLQGQPSRTVLVAVIDSGIDIDHEDLKSVIWTNEDEIPANGIDDDKNGYIDDVHGWNFIGGKEGNVTDDSYELTREYARLKKVFEGTTDANVGKKQRAEYERYKSLKDKYEKRKAKEEHQYELFSKQFALYQNIEKNLLRSVDTLKLVLKTSKLTPADVEQLQTHDPTLLFSKGLIGRMLKTTDRTDIDSMLLDLRESIVYYKSAVDEYKTIVEFGYNVDFDSRTIVGDNYADPLERNYGNNDVKGPDSNHGTHVAGVIGADRTNNIGIMGIADNVRIMSVRAVPNGDERDKDVANAIRYAVDNGAQVVNMSFGKSISPQKAVVDEAVRYAEKKGVILVHASGNDNQDIDKERDFPSRLYLDGKEAKNWLEVGATTWAGNENFVASFSNYGKKSVDFFAPGETIYSPKPENLYDNVDGTSFSSPMAAGVAALLLSYFPDLSPLQIVDILKKSTRKFDGLKVQKPGGGKSDFSDLSITGGVINAYEAVKMAMSMRSPVEK